MADDVSPARDPGAPIGKDEIDPELVSLRRSAPRIGTITAAAIVILCVVLLVRLRHDFSFARQSDAPRAVTPEQIVAGQVDAESYVTLTAPLELSAAVRTRVTEANAGLRVVPVAGTGDKLWVALPGDPWSSAAHDEQVTGRLRSLGDSRFGAAAIRYARKAPRPRFTTGAALRRARAALDEGGTPSVELVGGGDFNLTRDDEIEIAVPDPGAAVVAASLDSRLPTVEAWGEALATAGLIAPGTPPLRSDAELARWEVRRPGATDATEAVQQVLDNAALWGARVEPSMVRFRTKLGELRSSAGGVIGPDGATIPWSAVDVVAMWAPRAVPAGARVVIAGEKPDSYWYLTPVYVGLGLFALLFTWALAMAARRQFFDAR